MKFKIRFADQIVGFFVVFAILSLIVVIFLLGSKQRWFAKDYQYITYLESASGLSNNMPVQFKGFTIGKVKSSSLTKDDRVEVVFTIYDIYNDRVTEGSLIELSSPLGGLVGNNFQFYPGLGGRQLNEGDYIPSAASPEGRAYTQRGMTSVPSSADSITIIIDRVNAVLGQVQEAFAGTDQTSIGRVVGSLDGTISEIQLIATNLEETITPVLNNINEVVAGLNSIISDPDGLVSNILSTEGEVYTSLITSLKALAGIIQSLDKTAAFLPSELPKIAGLIAEVRAAISTAEDVLVALTNNPLLKKGIPEQVEIQSSGTNPRDVEF